MTYRISVDTGGSRTDVVAADERVAGTARGFSGVSNDNLCVIAHRRDRGGSFTSISARARRAKLRFAARP